MVGTSNLSVNRAQNQACVPCSGSGKQPACASDVWAAVLNLFTRCHQKAFAGILRVGSIMGSIGPTSLSVLLWLCRLIVCKGVFLVNLPNSLCAIKSRLERLVLEWVRAKIFSW